MKLKHLFIIVPLIVLIPVTIKSCTDYQLRSLAFNDPSESHLVGTWDTTGKCDPRFDICTMVIEGQSEITVKFGFRKGRTATSNVSDLPVLFKHGGGILSKTDSNQFMIHEGNINSGYLLTYHHGKLYLLGKEYIKEDK